MACLTHVLFALFVVHAAAGGDGFLGGPSRGASPSEEDFQTAMGTVMGCGGSVAEGRLSAVKQALQPMWRVLPKNQHGLVEWRMVRYLTHRYFMQQSSLLVRGFEPTRQVNDSHLGTAEILSDRVPSLVESVMESKRSSSGFSLDEVVAMIATLNQLIMDAESTLLEAAYARKRQSTSHDLSHADLSKVIESYMLSLFIGEDEHAIGALAQNSTLLLQVFPRWYDIKGFVDGVVKGMEFAAQKSPRIGHAQAALAGQYAYSDAHAAVGSITKGFASFWENECQLIKESLVALDKTGTGRVSLKDFYGANADGEWRFGESEAYLRELGILDESSPWRGKQVIIPNYLQGASNCIVATKHYLVCCVNECETVLNEVEDAVGTPMAAPEDILILVSNMSNFDDEPPNVDAALRAQLMSIAGTHGGKVPLHGRLFAQWLHYVFPRECAFPHKAGVHSALTPQQYGDTFYASHDEVNIHAAMRNVTTPMQADIEEAQWMTQWSEEEELHADYSLQLEAPWENTRLPVLGAVLATLALTGVAGILKVGSAAQNSKGFGGAIIHKTEFV